MKVTRISAGNYKITNKGREFAARKNEVHGQWELYEVFQITETNPIKREEWMQTYQDFGSCKIYVDDYLD